MEKHKEETLIAKSAHSIMKIKQGSNFFKKLLNPTEVELKNTNLDYLKKTFS